MSISTKDMQCYCVVALREMKEDTDALQAMFETSLGYYVVTEEKYKKIKFLSNKVHELAKELLD